MNIPEFFDYIENRILQLGYSRARLAKEMQVTPERLDTILITRDIFMGEMAMLLFALGLGDVTFRVVPMDEDSKIPEEGIQLAF